MVDETKPVPADDSREARFVGDDSDAEALVEWNPSPRELTDEEKAALAKLYGPKNPPAAP
jgi:hypothetical protein